MSEKGRIKYLETVIDKHRELQDKKDKRIADLERQLAEKDRQIEAMKSCYNCAWVSNDGSGCCQRPDNEYDTCISQKHWEAKEV